MPRYIHLFRASVLGTFAILALCAGAMLPGARPAAAEKPETSPINAVIGNQSWTAKFGTAPTSKASEAERLQVHLAFVLGRLRNVNIGHLSATQQKNRQQALASLDEYIRRGEFPKRTNDPYAGRRPRFIDDDGTHCAVGYLITASGDAKLARSVNENFEYAYISQIASAGLARWALDAGFTTTELATIQPGYERPRQTQASMRQALHNANEVITLICAKKHRPTKTVRLDVVGYASGRVAVSTMSTNPFSTCYAVQASRMEPGDYARGANQNISHKLQPIAPPQPLVPSYKFTTEATIVAPVKLLEKRLRIDYLQGRTTGCLPRPGPIPTTATFDIRTNNTDGLQIEVTTSPANKEAARCLKRYVRNRMSGFEKGGRDLHIRKTRTLPPVLQSVQLREELKYYTPQIATACSPKAPLPQQATVTVAAKRDATHFDIQVSAGSASFRSCMQYKLQKAFRDRYTATRTLENGNTQLFFRIDGDATITHSFTFAAPKVVPPKATRQTEPGSRSTHSSSP